MGNKINRFCWSSDSRRYTFTKYTRTTSFVIACSDETTAIDFITTGGTKLLFTFRQLAI